MTEDNQTYESYVKYKKEQDKLKQSKLGSLFIRLKVAAANYHIEGEKDFYSDKRFKEYQNKYQEINAEMIKIIFEYESQIKKLQALEAGGVDNWEWYSESLKDWFKEQDDEEGSS